MTKNRLSTILIAAAFVLVAGALIIYLLGNGGKKKTEIKWNFLGQDLSINMEEDLMDYKTMLDKLFSEEFSANGTKAWLKDHQNLYSPSDPDIAAQIMKLDYDEVLSQKLRDLSFKRKGPWSYQYDTVRIGIPSAEDQPRAGFANVCENGDYFSQRLRVFTMDLSKHIDLISTGRYECPEGFRYPDIQLNAKDAEQLLGTNNFLEIEKGIVLVLND